MITGLFFLRRRTTAFKNFKVDKTERHETKSETGHDTSKAYEKTTDAGVCDPCYGSKRYAFIGERYVVASQHPTHRQCIQQIHHRHDQGLLLLLLSLSFSMYLVGGWWSRAM